MARITLTRLDRSDAAELIRTNLANRDHHAPWVHPFTDLAGFENRARTIAGGAHVCLVARETASGSLVGVVELSQIVLGSFCSAYLSYYGMAEFAGRGLMTEAVRAAIGVAFEEVGLHRLEANIQPANRASIALVRRLGFRLEGFSPRYLRIDGTWRDHERWALLADEVPG
ncbi:GNAT family N-acetyltransferase [Lichenicola sp.]|uniref:GNAT family N-acetyltransferase n=1 Tax=Lichenicola sp. TaxID=2804529 RepID=UPI003B006D68